MSQYPRSASQFLASTFAPFGGGQRDDQAPLFFSTVDGESSAGGLPERHDDDDEHSSSPNFCHYGSESNTVESGRSIAHDEYDQRHDAYHSQQKQEGRTAASTQASSSYGHDDRYDHDGLGRTPSETGSDDNGDPFRSHATPSRQSGSSSAVPSRRRRLPQQSTSATAGWRMHATNLLPSVKQSVLNSLYEQSESVYSSVFIGNKQDKGKQRAVDIPDNTTDAQSPSSGEHENPPNFLASTKAAALLPPRRAVPEQPSYRQTDSMQQLQETSQRPPRIHRFPMPTSRYRRAATSGKDASVTAPDMEWQDQSYRDPAWLAIYLFNLLFTALLSLYLLLFDSTPKLSSFHLIAPSLAILRSIPLLSLLVFASLLVTVSSLAYTLLIKNGARQAAFAFIVTPPILFLIGAGWAFESSFSLEYSDPQSIQLGSSWAQTTLRMTSILLLGCSALAFRRTWQTLFSTGSGSRRARLERTIRVLQVSADVIIQHPHLLLLAIALVGAYIVSSVPAILIIAQLLYHGAIEQASSPNTSEKFTYIIPGTWSILLSLHTAFVYFWTLGLFRAVYQHTIAGTVATWWYKAGGSSLKAGASVEAKQEEELETKQRKASLSQARENVLDSFHRAIGPSLGTLCASSLVLAILSLFTLLISLCYSLVNKSRRWTGPDLGASALRILVNFIVLPLIGILSSMIRNLNAFTLIYSAVTGDKFWDASSEATELIMGRNGTDMVASHLMIRSLLSIFSFALAFLGGLAGYVSSVYWLSAPATFPDASAREVTQITPLLVAFVCGIVPFWTVRFSSDLLSNAVDATFVCFNIDLDTGETKHEQAYEAFAYEEDEDDQDIADEEHLAFGMSGLYGSDSGQSV
ncbi:hypothetical protein P389DRAFT_171391 [Cystobasidium minutum MCA 4210]|uniref:uncharacterized protein n=1 Tax=Cystobasidium minutum MCA 4210 TaxID=1397322 RepID=UPI0034CEF3AA|eukprot:jgi/Rhomi1/171391/fgenesh1_kg.4_\